MSNIYKFDYTGSPQSVTLPAGKYLLECWGAEGGGTSSANNSGKGGYSKGIVNLIEPTTLNVYVGGAGLERINTGGFNGGGTSYNSDNGQRGSGGGATDIRLDSSLYSRIIVAGGGAGGYYFKSSYYSGGSAGCNGSTGDSGAIGTAGTDKAPGNNSGKFSGSFGIGGSYENTNTVCGGGGGWYGGGGGNTAGGGSNYAFTSSSYKPSGYNPSTLYLLEETQLINGNLSMPSPSGGSETGHKGNGYCIITCLELFSSVKAHCKIDGAIKEVDKMSVKIDGAWKEVDSVYVKIDGNWKKSE